MNTFPSLKLADHLLLSIRDLGFDSPTPIQAQAIPVILAGHDVAAEAQTGSGKTAAFVLPVLQRICAAPQLDPAPIRVLTLAPTRELALQVAGVYRSLARRAPRTIKILGVIGGEPSDQQIAALAKGVDVVVATPGRLLDLIGQDVLDLSRMEVLVLDEADKLLDQGFSDALAALLPLIPARRQTLVFSATLPQALLDLSAPILRDPVTLRVDDAPAGPVGIQQRVIEVDADGRRMLLQHLVEAESWQRALVFVATQRASDLLAAKLRKAGIGAASLHGGLDQDDRASVLGQFKNGKFRVLVATDLAARGIDVPKLSAVVNFDLPRSPRDYLHRIGRTGRAGETGVAVTFIDHGSAAHFRVIERQSQIQLPREQLLGFELSGDPHRPSKGQAPKKGARKSKKDKLRELAAQDEPLATRAPSPEAG